jgi:hypothetical protein
MRIILTLSFFVIISFSVSAQVGINTPDPDTNSILDLKSNNKGLLIPRLSTTDREAMSSVKFSQGMMVYDITLDILFVGYGNGASSTKWYAMNPWKTEYRTDNNANTADMTTMTATGVKHGNIGIGVPAPAEKLHVAGKVKATGFVGNLAGNVAGNATTAGTVTGAIQGAITSVGILKHLNVGVSGAGVIGSVQCSDWFRTTGNGGWYSQTHYGGWHMTDNTWIRNYNDKAVWLEAASVNHKA